MNKRVFIVHGWSGHPKEGWFPWLKRELELQGFFVFVPQMPNSNEPRIIPWVKALADSVGVIDRDTYFVGHSMGCQTIVRYLEREESSIVSGGAVFVAGFFSRLTNIASNDLEKSVIKEWLETPIDLEKVKKRLVKSIAIFSDNDPFVPLDNRITFETVLGSEVVVVSNQQHFSGDTGTDQLPIVEEALLKIVTRK